ncbi:MAG: hypothetical protein RLZZ15_755 [Verrucomicrobiota bacterium]|jgi:TRAP-type C4-dicarboxylate transport system substrate-binding protein
MKRPFPLAVAALILLGTVVVAALAGCARDETIVLRGASQFDEKHVFTRTLRKFEQLVPLYYGKPVRFELYLNSELGLEKDYFVLLSQGVALDYALVSPSHMATFAPAAPLMDMPFLFRDRAHWRSVLATDAFQPIVDEVLAKADVRLLGYAGGGERNLIVKRRVTNPTELTGLNIRVMGAPIQTRIFEALRTKPTIIAYDEIYSAIQTGVIDAAENEAAGIKQMKFYEVGPEISLTQHAITVRPLVFSEKTLRRLPADLQAAIHRAGREAGAFGREQEAAEDAATLRQMEKDGKLRTHPFAGRDELLKRVESVKRNYAAEIGATAVLSRIDALP